MRTMLRPSRSGFTLVELLVVVLILATLMAVALPLYLNAISDSSKKTCRGNMQSIANAAMAWKMRHHPSDLATLSLADLKPDLGAVPTCPNGGTYTLVPAGGTVIGDDDQPVTVPSGYVGIGCSHAEHNGFVPGIMSR